MYEHIFLIETFAKTYYLLCSFIKKCTQTKKEITKLQEIARKTYISRD